MKTGPHIIVIGAGIVGASAAFALARAGARVTVIEVGVPGGGATAASFGWINASFHLNEAHYRLRVAGIEAWHRLDRDLPGGTGAIWSGALNWECAGAALEAEAARLAALGYPARIVGGAELRTMEPDLAGLPAAALHLPSEGAVDAGDVTRRLTRAAQDRGARLWAGVRATGLTVAGTRVTGVMTDGGPVAADHVVLAAGTAAPGLLAPLDVALPMLTRPGLTLRTRAVPRVLRHILVVPGTEIRQDAEGRIWMPTATAHQSDESEELASPSGDLADAALARLAALFPGAGLAWDTVMTGWRPVPGDGLPVLGAPEGIHGLTVAVMHSGVTLAAVAGEAVAAAVMRGSAGPLFAPFGPARFA